MDFYQELLRRKEQLMKEREMYRSSDAKEFALLRHSSNESPSPRPPSPRTSPRRRPQSPSVFDRQKWLARANEQRMREFEQSRATQLMQVSPVLMQKQLKGTFKPQEFSAAIRAISTGGENYASWSAEQRPSLLRRSSPRASPRSLRPMTARPKNLLPELSAAGATGARPSSAVAPWPVPLKPPPSESGGDDQPVTDAELEEAFDAIKGQLNTKFSQLRKAFQMLDEDRSGKVTRFEAMRLLKTFNLSGVRQKVIHQICAIVDSDGDGMEFGEFCEMMQAEDVLPLLKAKRGVF